MSKQIKSNDLVGYLYTKWQEENPKSKKATDFVEFARSFLSQNPPVSFDYISRGNGVTLSNGDRVNFLDIQDEQEFQMYSGEVAVTGTNRNVNVSNMYSVKI